MPVYPLSFCRGTDSRVLIVCKYIYISNSLLLRSMFVPIAPRKERTWYEVGTNMVRTWCDASFPCPCRFHCPISLPIRLWQLRCLWQKARGHAFAGMPSVRYSGR